MLKLKVMVVRKIVLVVVVHRAHHRGEIRAQVVQVAHRVEERRGKRKVVQQEIINEVCHKQTQLPPLSSQW